jgi:hypothetical protein
MYVSCIAYDMVRMKLIYLIKVCAYGETLFSTLYSHQKLKIYFNEPKNFDLLNNKTKTNDEENNL